MRLRNERHVVWVLPSALGLAIVAAMLVTGCRKTNEDKPAQSRNDPKKDPQTSKPETAAGMGDGPAVGDLNKVGNVAFPTDCDSSVQKAFERGIALLHSFFYSEARRTFEEVAKNDPDCAIAYWGVAMTWYHPLWAAPTPEEMESGRKAIEQATKTAKSEHDKAFIEPLTAFYVAKTNATSQQVGQSCHGPSAGGHIERARAWQEGMGKAYEKYPDDEEVGAFYALSLLGSAPPVDPELKNQKKAAEILEKYWAKRKDHPGVAHYLIHAHDYPPLAESGLVAAKEYAAIAPTVPHALHMPSHIFVRLGMWPEAVDSNLASADAARAYAAQKHPGAMGFEELHAFDYLVYGYLQMGKDDSAKEIADRLAAVKKTFPEIDFTAAYAMAAVPARMALERHAWKEAAELALPTSAAWAKFPFSEAHVEYARGLGRARSGDIDGAKKSLARLGELRDATTDPKFAYFKNHVDLQQQAVSAWIANAEGKKDAAVKMMRKAAELEDKLGKHPVSPGPTYPIYEQLGDLLLDLGRPAEALAAYEASLKTSPKRFNSLYGAGRAAVAAKKPAEARKYYEDLVAIAGAATRPELAEVKKVLAAGN